jgi:glycoprotein endo-alpha-1,2-mannosidase
MAGQGRSSTYRRGCGRSTTLRLLTAAGFTVSLVTLPGGVARATTPASSATSSSSTTRAAPATPTAPTSTPPTSTPPASATPASATSASTTPATVTLTPPSAESPLVGAYYSDWYPTNAGQGTLRADLVPPQGASNAQLNDADPAVAEKAISQASQNGINFFAMDYWPQRPAQNANIDAFLQADNIADIKFCIFYETWDSPTWDPSHESTPVNAAMEANFDANLTTFAQKYFDNPSYLKIDGRPVLVLYLTRTLTGDVSGLISSARQTLEALGYNPYIIGDEIFWRVTSVTPPTSGSWLTQTPQAARIWDFDAITTYGLYSGGDPDPNAPQADFENYPGLTNIVSDETNLYKKYAAATGGEVPVIPDATPGENTRGVRLSVNEHAEPRQWLPGEGPASTLAHYLDLIDKPVIDPRVPMVFVTTWNEWNEDTGVQPVGGIATNRDNSPTGQEYTQGYTYGGEGDSDLVTIRNFVAVAWGQVKDKAGKPVAGATVTAVRDGLVVSSTEANSQGWYVLRRTTQATGTLSIADGDHYAAIHASPTKAIRADLRT